MQSVSNFRGCNPLPPKWPILTLLFAYDKLRYNYVMFSKMKFDNYLESKMKKSTVFPRILLVILALTLLSACSKTKLTPGQEIELTQEAEAAQNEPANDDAAPEVVMPTAAPVDPAAASDGSEAQPDAVTDPAAADPAAADPADPAAADPAVTDEGAAAPAAAEGGTDTPTAVPADDAGTSDADSSTTDDAAPAPVASDGSYIVQRGDNLFRIGLNNGCTTEEMSAANNIEAPYTIYIGQTIIIPDCD